MEKDKLHMKKSGFKVPENYFSEFENHLSDSITSKTMLPKESGFKVPESYFDTIETSIVSKVLPKKKTKVIKMSWFYNAAGIAAIFVIGFFINNTLSKQNNTEINRIAVSEIDAYIDEGYFSLNTFEITEAFNDVSLSEIDMSSALNEDDIFDYLEENMNTYGGTITENK
ncbi:MAG: hypothetical protein V7691_09840 [Galbibacter orientalis]|uniref:hypothetical protein n=1 Tax=Galbibacter orientalis TaxID=453852 RepID=UPI0030018AF8